MTNCSNGQSMITNCISYLILISEKLNVELDVIKNSVEGLVNLLLESCKYKVRPTKVMQDNRVFTI